MEAGALTGPVLPHPAARRGSAAMLVLCITGAFMAFLDVTLVNIAFPDLERSFPRAGADDLSWVINGYSIALAALLLPAGSVADRLGRRRVFLAGLSVFLAGSALCGVAPSVGALVAARVVQGLGGAVLIPTALALALPFFPGERRMVATSAYAAAGAAASAAGPSLGGLLVDAAGWRAAFLVNLPIGAAVIAARRLLPESRDPSAAPVEAGAAALGAASVGLLTLGIVKAPAWGWTGTGTLACWAAAACGALLLRARRTALVPADLRRIATFRWGLATTLLLALPFFAILLCNVLFLTGVWHRSVLDAGLQVSPAPALAVLSARPAVALAARIGAGRVVAAAAAGLSAAALLYRGLGASPDFAGAWLPVQLLSGVSLGAGVAALNDASVMDLPGGRLAAGAGVLACARQVGAVLGVAILVAVLGTPGTPAALLAAFHRAYLLIAAAGLVVAVQALRAPSRPRAAAATPAAPPRAPAAAPAPPPSRPATRIHEVLAAGVRWNVRDTGHGPPVVLVHGALDSGDAFRSLARRLARDHGVRVIAPDLPGHGSSSLGPALPAGAAGQAEALVALLDALAIRRAVLVGHSFGGLVAGLVAARHPQRCAGLVLLAPGGLGRAIHPLIRVLSVPGAGPVLAALAHPAVQRRRERLLSRLPLARTVLDVTAQLRDARRRRAFLDLVRAHVGPDGQRDGLGPLLRDVRAPALVLWGARDGLLPAQQAAAARAMPRARVELLPAAGHNLHLDEPGAVREAVARFLSDLERKELVA